VELWCDPLHTVVAVGRVRLEKKKERSTKVRERRDARFVLRFLLFSLSLFKLNQNNPRVPCAYFV